MDRIEGIGPYEIWFVPEGALVICHVADRSPAVFECEGENFVFVFSQHRTDKEILDALRRLHQAGFKEDLMVCRADIDLEGKPSQHLAAGAGEDFHLLLDVPLANFHTFEKMEFAEKS